MDITTETCWADPLSSTERAKLARILARHCKRFHAAAVTVPGVIAGLGCLLVSADLSDLHLDVTERAEVPRRESTP